MQAPEVPVANRTVPDALVTTRLQSACIVRVRPTRADADARSESRRAGQRRRERSRGGSRPRVNIVSLDEDAPVPGERVAEGSHRGDMQVGLVADAGLRRPISDGGSWADPHAAGARAGRLARRLRLDKRRDQQGPKGGQLFVAYGWAPPAIQVPKKPTVPPPIVCDRVCAQDRSDSKRLSLPRTRFHSQTLNRATGVGLPHVGACSPVWTETCPPSGGRLSATSTAFDPEQQGVDSDRTVDSASH